MTKPERQDPEAQAVTTIVAQIFQADPAGNWADALDQALTDAGIDLEGVAQPDGSDSWEIVRYRATDGAICLVYLAYESATHSAQFRVVEEEPAVAYRVCQTWETLGDPCNSTHNTILSATLCALSLRQPIIQHLLASPVHRDPAGYGSTNEQRGWAHAAELSPGQLYSRRAAEHIAESAVTITAQHTGTD